MAEKLREYRQKRDPTSTPEPFADEGPGDTGTAPARFVVQEHHARRLHWDLRLERDGVLASWAVPKGIPPRPDENHLAVRTEDHPLEYLEFHGEIPAGNYGAGTMEIWDSGTYETHKWRADEVMVTFHGERVRGRYVLFRTRGKDWMIHRMDPPEDPSAEPLPEEVEPMLARLGELPTGDEDDAWAYEVKWDGVRALVWVDGGRVRVGSRTGRDVTSTYPEVGGLGRALGSRPALLDGEIVAFDAEGRPSFERLQTRMHAASDSAVRRRVRDAPVTLMLFDVLHLDGRSLMSRPWTERRETLEALELEGDSWRTPAAHRAGGSDLLAATREQGLEGIIAKRTDARYEPGRRSGCWIKVKNVNRQEFVVGGWLAGEGRRRDSIGALLVGVHDPDGKLRYSGRVGTGFKAADLVRVGKLLAPLEQPRSPFHAGTKPPRGAVFVAPQLVCAVDFSEWTSAGMVRHPSWKGMREDRDPADVFREGREPEETAPAEAAPAKRRRTGTEVDIDGRRLKLSNLDKVLYPSGFTKAQVLDYYIRIAPVLLPHVAGRPLTLKRYPNGTQDKFFYEKNAPAHRPEWVPTVEVGDIRYVDCEDVPTLVWVANLASLELHTPMARAGADEPDLMVFDLDPGPPADIGDCCWVAGRLRELLDELGLEAVAKTSGSKGLQLYVPVTGSTARETSGFAKALAELLERRHPDRIVSRMTKSLRGGKVLVDWSQNNGKKTTVSVYSLRARDAPTVSTPVTWAEVVAGEEDGSALVFDAPAVLARVGEHGDLFAPTLAAEQRLPALG